MIGELLQPQHLLLILVIFLLFFGPGKLPQIAQNLGKSIREFKGALSAPDEVKVAAPQQPAQQPVQQAAQPQQAPAQPQAQQTAEAPTQEQKGA